MPGFFAFNNQHSKLPNYQITQLPNRKNATTGLRAVLKFDPLGVLMKRRVLLPPILFLVIAAVPLVAQKSGGAGKPSGSTTPPVAMTPSVNVHPEDEFTVGEIPKTITGEQQLSSSGVALPRCFHWPVSGTVTAKVSTTQLEVSEKAFRNFQDACSEVSGKKLEKAREHLEKAVQANPKYAAALVLLGQVQRDLQNQDAATKSCQQALAVDSSYLAPYLCLADLAARANKWDQVAGFTSQVLAQHPVKAPGAYYYNSLANLNLNQLDDAEKSGLEAVKDGPPEQKLQSRLLLAKIYEARGDRTSEAVQLREYLNLKPSAEQAEVAKRVLQQIDAQQAEKK
jgi:hypothetical protein